MLNPVLRDMYKDDRVITALEHLADKCQEAGYRFVVNGTGFWDGIMCPGCIISIDVKGTLEEDPAISIYSTYADELLDTLGPDSETTCGYYNAHVFEVPVSELKEAIDIWVN